MSGCDCGSVKVDKKLSVTPKSSPSSSPRPSPKSEISEEPQSSEPNDQNGGLTEEPVGSGLEGKSPNTDSTPLEATKNDASQAIVPSTKEKKKKKSSWFNTFYPTYKSRSEDFKRIFKEVPDEERLVVDYSCAVQKEILVHGRLYVTQNYLCFYANIFGWETNIVLKWKNVTAITKEKTAIVIPNAVLISTKTDKFFFTSFVARDKVYLMLFRVWQNALMDKQMSNQEMWKWVHQSYGAELGLTSEDEDYIAPSREEAKTNKVTSESPLEGENTSSDICKTPKQTMAQENRNGNSSTNSKKSTEAQDSTDDSDFSDLDIPAQCDIQDISCSCAHEGRQLLNEILPFNVDQLFTSLFTSSKFYLDFNASRKTTDLVQTPWTEEPKDNTKTRKVNMTVTLTQAIGPKSSNVTESQTMLQCSKPGYLYSINSESVSGGVPYGDSFVIEVHYCLKKVSDRQSSLNVSAQVKFKKSVWGLVKGMIEKNCWSGLEDYFAHLSKALKSESEGLVVDVKRKVKRKRKQHGSPRATTPVCSLDSSVTSKAVSLRSLEWEKPTLFIFLLIFLLLLLNVFLLLRLWSLEEGKPSGYHQMDEQLLKDPPATREEWLSLLKRQDRLHADEIKRWQGILKEAVELLKKLTETLLDLFSGRRKGITERPRRRGRSFQAWVLQDLLEVIPSFNQERESECVNRPMSCLGECLDLGPPPDLILFLPPPPAPSVLQHSLPDLLLNTTPCSAGQLCDAWVPLNKFPDSEDFVELSRKEVEGWSSLDDTWLLVLIASSIGVLLLGALLAMFLLKCREMNMFGSNECSLHAREPRPMKIMEQRDGTTTLNGGAIGTGKSDPSWHNSVGLHDNRIVWAALTPGGGTQHFISENYPKEFVDYREADDHYETIDNVKPNVLPIYHQSYRKSSPYQATPGEQAHFDNTGFVDPYEYEEPMPLIKSYQYDAYEDYQYTLPGGNTDMRCLSMAYDPSANGARRQQTPVQRPRVSQPTRIEHPNLPPLNLFPMKGGTLKRNTNLSYRNVDTGTLPKYTC